MERSLLNIKDVAEKLHVSRALVYVMVKRGDIPTVQIGKLIRVKPEDLERYIHERSLKQSNEIKNED